MEVSGSTYRRGCMCTRGRHQNTRPSSEDGIQHVSFIGYVSETVWQLDQISELKRSETIPYICGSECGYCISKRQAEVAFSVISRRFIEIRLKMGFWVYGGGSFTPTCALQPQHHDVLVVARLSTFPVLSRPCGRILYNFNFNAPVCSCTASYLLKMQAYGTMANRENLKIAH